MTGQSSITRPFLAAVFVFLVFVIGFQGPVAVGQQQSKPEMKAAQPALQKEIPKTPAGQRLAGLIETINSGNRSTFRSYISANFDKSFLEKIPLEEHVNVLSELYDGSRGFDVYGAQLSSDYELKATLQNRLTEGWELLFVKVNSSSPHGIISLQLRPSPPPPGLPPQKKLSQQEAMETLDAFLKKLEKEDAFSGSLLVAKDGKLLLLKVYGLASREFNVPNRVDTKFNLGSMNKMVTAVAIAQLVEKGKLSYDDLIGKDLGPDWIKEETGKKVMIKHLLSHTSGLGSYFNEKFMKSSRLLFRKVDDYKPLLVDDAPAFEPGTKWQYSNTGFLLLGAIIEKVTGQSYFDYVRESIFKPAGMVNTDSYEMDRPNPNLAIGYFKEFSGENVIWKNNIFEHVVKGGPAGGGFSTAEDLLRFDIALRADKLISAASRELLMTAKPELKSPDYGYGFGIGKSDKLGRTAGHSGGFPGISSILEMYLDSGYTVVALTNYGVGSQVAQQKIESLLTGLI
jgi:CubicO group peptidase (beta-lactamase class C family)